MYVDACAGSGFKFGVLVPKGISGVTVVKQCKNHRVRVCFGTQMSLNLGAIALGIRACVRNRAHANPESTVSRNWLDIPVEFVVSLRAREFSGS